MALGSRSLFRNAGYQRAPGLLNAGNISFSTRLPACKAGGLTAGNEAPYTDLPRWTWISRQRASSHSASSVGANFNSPAGISEISKLSREHMSSVKATQLRPGMVIQHEGQLFTIFSVDHRTPGNKRGSMQTRMRNLRTGAIIDEVEFEYLYSEGDDFHFMNTKNYEQMQMSREELGESVYYLIPSTIVKVEFFEEKPIGVDLPDTMDMKVIQTEPTLQKATASAVMKPATLETGLVVQVPPFVNEGDRIKVDTSEARYVQRVE